MEYQQKQVSIRDVTFGKNVTIVQPSNIYQCKLGDDCFVGPFVEIQNDVMIGDNCRVQSHSFICSLVSLGNNCFVGHGVIFVNDLFTSGGPAGNPALWKKTMIGNNVYFGSNSTILPVSICDNVVIGAGAVVTKNITVPGVYAGNPAKKLR
jgi:acetyltransferase-like isoleucine patch superfamily enzyme